MVVNLVKGVEHGAYLNDSRRRRMTTDTGHHPKVMIVTATVITTGVVIETGTTTDVVIETEIMTGTVIET